MKRFCVSLLLLSISCTFCQAGDLPDRARTPGAINPDVTQENIHETVCVRGWTKRVRPPKYFTNALKKIQLREFGYPNPDPRQYEEDHLIPLSLGGSPDDPRNLWPQPRFGDWNADRKDDLEFAIYRAVCREELTLDEAREAFRSNWIAAYRRYGAVLQRYGHARSN